MNMEITSGATLNRYSLTVPSCPHKLDVECLCGAGAVKRSLSLFCLFYQ